MPASTNNTQSTMSKLIYNIPQTAERAHINSPAIKFPITTGRTHSLNLRFKNTAIAVPVQTPVIGKGIATNKNTPSCLMRVSDIGFPPDFCCCFSSVCWALSAKYFSTFNANPFTNIIFFNRLSTGRNKKYNRKNTTVEPT